VSHPQTRIPDVPRSSGGRARRQSVGRIVVGERVPLRLQGPLFGESKAESHFREMFDRHIVTVFHSVGKREREQLCPALHSNSVTVMDNGWAEWVAAVTSTGAVSQAAIHGHDGCVRVFILLVQSTCWRNSLHGPHIHSGCPCIPSTLAHLPKTVPRLCSPTKITIRAC
jgi:hypothetical protein